MPCSQPLPATLAPQRIDARMAADPLRIRLSPEDVSRRREEEPRQLESRIADGQGREAYLFAPEGRHPGNGWPLLVVLHGCWQFRTEHDQELNAALFGEWARRAGVAVLVPFALQHTWDFVMSQGREGVDTEFLKYAMDEARRLQPIDDARIAVLGFSDGASYGLSLALANPDVFSTALVWAAGFCLPPPAPPPALPWEGSGTQRSGPRVLMWHGTEDTVFDINSISMPLRERLVQAGYPVTYHAEEGGRHVCPQPGSEFCDLSLAFWLNEGAPSA